jgi:hypothetical protein
LKDVVAPRTLLPFPGKVLYQQGDLILQKVDELPGAVPIEDED